MKSDYDYYVIGCGNSNLTPLPQQQFQQTYVSSEEGDIVSTLVRLGKAAAGDTGSLDGEGGAASGVRQPRSPQEPVLTGQAARSLPSVDAPDTAFWRT